MRKFKDGIDGFYVPKTTNAVKRFQLMHRFSSDGIYEPQKKVKLESLLQKGPLSRGLSFYNF